MLALTNSFIVSFPLCPSCCVEHIDSALFVRGKFASGSSLTCRRHADRQLDDAARSSFARLRAISSSGSMT
jgi:hypothetical protein